jgi:hypothetical protein
MKVRCFESCVLCVVAYEMLIIKFFFIKFFKIRPFLERITPTDKIFSSYVLIASYFRTVKLHLKWL